MSNNWNQPPTGNQPAGGRELLSGNHLREYQPQPPQNQQQNQQMNPAAPYGPAMPNPYSPMPPAPPAQMPQHPLPQQMNGGGLLRPQGWVTNTVDVMRRLSGKVAAVARPPYQPPPYQQYPQQPPAPQMVPQYAPQMATEAETAQPKTKPWKRSLITKITRQRRDRGGRKGSKWGRIALGVVLCFLTLLIILLSSGGVYAYSYYQKQLPRLHDLANLQISQTSRIYDRNLVPLYDVYNQDNQSDQCSDQKLLCGGRSTPIAYKYIPKVMQDAMTSAEDPSFWKNPGLDASGISRAVYCQVTHCPLTVGGSTLTQQLVKNLTRDDRQSIDRKISEATLAIGLTQDTQNYPKWRILEMYFNIAPYGSQDMGIEAAVEEYFGLQPQCDKNFNCTPGIAQLRYNTKTKKDDPLLGLARASFLAGLPQSPYEYDPTLGASFRLRALDRQKYVLDQMIKTNIVVDGLGQVTPDIAKQAEALSASWQFTRYQHAIKFGHFVNWVLNEVELALGNGHADVGKSIFSTGGFHIRTTLDSNLETYVESTVKRHLLQPEQQPYGPYVVASDYYNINDSAVVVENAKTGEILAMNGSLDYNFDKNNPDANALTKKRVSGQVNIAASPRQPGSTMKPIVYATTFAMGWYPGMVLPDFQTYFPNGGAAGLTTDPNDKTNGMYAPPDYGGGHHNFNSTIRVALTNSFNVPAVKAISYAGIDNVLNTAKRMGITDLDRYKRENIGVSLTLGTYGISPLQMTAAYQTFANQGAHVPPQGVLDVWDNFGHNLYHSDPTKMQVTQVFSPQVAYMISSVLSDEQARAYEFGNNHTLSFWDWDGSCTTLPWGNLPRCAHDVAAKTGTTDLFVDNWTIGYTPSAVVGVWAGNANNDPMENNPTGITGAGPIWHSIMEYVSGHCNSAIDNIPCPPLDRKALGLTAQKDQFDLPANIHQQCVSDVNGLKGNSKNCDWILDGQEPQQTGMQAGNNNNNNDPNGNNNNDPNGNNNNNNNDNNANNTGK